MRQEGEEHKLTVAQAAVLTGVSEATLRDRLDELAATANGGPPALSRGRAELEPVAPSEVAQRTDTHQFRARDDLTLKLVAHLEAQAAEISRLTAMASQAEALSEELSAERQEREELQDALEGARSELQALKSHIGGLKARHHHRLDLETELVRTQAELSATKAQLTEAHPIWRNVFASKFPLRRSRRELANEREKGQRDALEAELVEVRGALERAQRRIAELQDADTQRAALHEQLAIAQRELQDARARTRESASGRSWRGLSLVGNILGRGR